MRIIFFLAVLLVPTAFTSASVDDLVGTYKSTDGAVFRVKQNSDGSFLMDFGNSIAKARPSTDKEYEQLFPQTEKGQVECLIVGTSAIVHVLAEGVPGFASSGYYLWFFSWIPLTKE